MDHEYLAFWWQLLMWITNIFGHVCFIENIRDWETISTILKENIIDESFVIKVMSRHFSRVNVYYQVQIFGNKEFENKNIRRI